MVSEVLPFVCFYQRIQKKAIPQKTAQTTKKTAKEIKEKKTKKTPTTQEEKEKKKNTTTSIWTKEATTR